MKLTLEIENITSKEMDDLADDIFEFLRDVGFLVTDWQVEE